MTKPHNEHPVAPGSHEAKSSFGVGPKFSISMKPNDVKNRAHPGPGDYNHISQVGNDNNYSMLNPRVA